MKKDEFLKKLKERLEIFTNEEQAKIIQEYQAKIEESASEEKIKQLGSLDKIQEEIFLNHGINPSKVKKQTISKKLEELVRVIQDVVEQMSHNSVKENAQIILDLLVLLFLICILKLPFIFIRNIGENLLLPLEMPLLITIWGLILDIIYIIIAVIVFVNIFTKWFNNKKERKEMPSKKEQNKNGKPLEAITLEEEK